MMPRGLIQPPFRAGLIGAGGIARIHAEVLTNRLHNTELVAVCDISPDILHEFGQTYGVSGLFTDLDDMLSSAEMDFVIICNWGVDHAETSIQISESEKVPAILCEKPFAMDAAEASDMIETADRHGVMLAEAYKFRHHPMHLRAKAMVDEGAIGNVVCIRSSLVSGRKAPGDDPRNPSNDWRFNRAKGGGSVNDLGCYCLAHARYIYSAEPIQVFAHAHMGSEVDDRASVEVVFPGRRHAQFAVGFNSWTTQGVEIIGSCGLIRIDKPWNNSDLSTDLHYETFGEQGSMHFKELLQYTCQIQHFCECLATGEPYRIPLRESVDQMKALDAINRSIATGNAVTLKR